MSNVLYLFINPNKQQIVKCRRFSSASGWKCYGKYSEGSERSIESCESDYTLMIANGYEGLSEAASMKMVA